MTMNIKIFAKMVSVHGADISRWDGVNRDEAKMFAAQDMEARELLDEAALLDRMLARYQVGKPGPEALNRIMDAAEKTVQERPGLFSAGSVRPSVVYWGMGLAASFVLMLAASVQFVPSLQALKNGQAQVAQAEQASVDQFVGNLPDADADDTDAQQMIALLDTVQTRSQVDKFLDDVMGKDSEDEADVWDEFLDGGPGTTKL